MATRFYFRPVATPQGFLTPAFDGSWTRNTEGVRRTLAITKPSDAMVSFTAWANTSPAANASALFAQFISPPLATGIAFATTDTMKCYIRCMESATNDNINRQFIAVKIINYNGDTVQATLKALGHYGPNTTEWVNGTLTNKTFADGDTLGANYTTVDGDRLLVEIGGEVSSAGGTSVTGTMEFGSNNASDLGENESDATALNPWFEISRTFALRVNSMPVWQKPWRRWLINQRRAP